MRVFVHKDHTSHRKLRAKLKRLHKRGTVTLVSKTRQGWVYEVPPFIKIAFDGIYHNAVQTMSDEEIDFYFERGCTMSGEEIDFYFEHGGKIRT